MLIRHNLIHAAGAVTLACSLASAAVAQATRPVTDSSRAASPLGTVVITATRSPTSTRNVAPSVSVVDSASIARRLATNAADALRAEAGVDILGTGVNQGRPAIRGHRGQRILLLADGLRLNNSRRQQDFGELPALVDVDQLARIEIIRGPASVLYGTDAIGGVVNLIRRDAAGMGGGRLTYQHGSAGALGKAGLSIGGTHGAWSASLNYSARVAGDYEAPAGRYGSVTLASRTPVQHSGVRDRNLAGSLDWRSAGGLELFARGERYQAEDAGFGYIPPELIGNSRTRIEILYPAQEYNRISAGVRNASLASTLANRAELTVYQQRNERDFTQHIFAPFGGTAPPSAGADIRTWNFTDIVSSGFRAEAAKVAGRVTFTYGADLFSDRSANTDSSVTTIVGFGPPQTRRSTRPQVPNASLTSGGVFAQGDIRVLDRFSVILGARGQHVSSEPRATAGRSDSLRAHATSTGVYAVNAVWRATDDLSVVATVGRGFRSPNLVERFFDGPTPEGSAYQRSAPGLRPESSLNYDAGIKATRGRLSGEVSLFRNDLSDAIAIAASGEREGTLPVFQNVNVHALRVSGGEASAAVVLPAGFGVSANYSTLESKNITAPNSPVGDTYSSRVNGAATWTSNGNRWWVEYAVRHNGEKSEIAAAASPVGPELPAFTVQDVRAGLRNWAMGGVRQSVTMGVKNIGNVLYAESANASFFRPEPGRHFVVALTTSF